jgi:hypothetical protein
MAIPATSYPEWGEKSQDIFSHNQNQLSFTVFTRSHSQKPKISGEINQNPLLQSNSFFTPINQAEMYI